MKVTHTYTVHLTDNNIRLDKYMLFAISSGMLVWSSRMYMYLNFNKFTANRVCNIHSRTLQGNCAHTHCCSPLALHNDQFSTQMVCVRNRQLSRCEYRNLTTVIDVSTYEALLTVNCNLCFGAFASLFPHTNQKCNTRQSQDTCI